MEKSLFSYVIHNIVLKQLIFYYISYIHRAKDIKAEKWDVYSKSKNNLVYHGYTDLLKKSLKQTEISSKEKKLSQLAALRGHLDIVKLFQRRGDLSGNEVNICVNSGNLELFKYLADEVHQTVTVDAMDNCARLGDLKMLKWFHENRSEGCSYKAIDYSAINNNTEIVQWLYENRTEGCSHVAFDWAARNGNIPMLQMLLVKNNNVHNFTTKAIDLAAEQGQLEVLEYLRVNFPDLKCTTDAVDNAAANGHLEVIKHLLTHRREGGSNMAMHCAAVSGHLDIVRYLHENSTVGCLSSTISLAIRRSQQEVVRFLLDNRGERDHSELTSACVMGDMSTAQLLIEHYRYVPNIITLELTIDAGKMDTFLYAYSRIVVDPVRVAMRLVFSGHGEMFKYYLDHLDLFGGFDIRSYKVTNYESVGPLENYINEKSKKRMLSYHFYITTIYINNYLKSLDLPESSSPSPSKNTKKTTISRRSSKKNREIK
ncbi:hypothetical protein PPL_11724 [Heterostelium album PN500]|uniref:Ankyrin repeat protein n=1 Tax=Heterostelium pallidum (strain ATCC 26659 / Pp 5 / PN500) TaxID=670386 RepID=D3BUA5_HETP5|nr:hypothetical protein PPL_11724 [Heterostelium album PN500]EFA75039.1 hypothetical protein PPL_11724 [Heterostelium album PN500]|eukprot:XP_020427173.1 hypothetical protein PPL_11724 [Heterostelium album PN500]